MRDKILRRRKKGEEKEEEEEGIVLKIKLYARVLKIMHTPRVEIMRREKAMQLEKI